MTFYDALGVIFWLGTATIMWRSIRYSGLIVGTVYGLFKIIPWLFSIAIIGLFAAMVGIAANNYAEVPEQKQEQSRQEQIAATGVDPCADFHEDERVRRTATERIKNGEVSDAELALAPLYNEAYANMTWEERDAALKHDHEMRQKCPPLDFIEPRN